MSRKHSRAARRKRISGAATAGRKPLSAQVSEREARLLRELEAERLENLRLRQTIDALQQASAPPAKGANELVPVRKKPRTRQEEWDASFPGRKPDRARLFKAELPALPVRHCQRLLADAAD